MSSVTNNLFLPNWPTSKSGLCNLAEVLALVFAFGFLGNLRMNTFYPPDRDYGFTYFGISAMHLGYLSFFVVINILGEMVPKFKDDYYRNNRAVTFIVDTATHISSWYIFLKLTNEYGYTSDIYVSYFLRAFLTIFIWYTRTARQRRVNYE